jgi:hypothetical protein
LAYSCSACSVDANISTRPRPRPRQRGQCANGRDRTVCAIASPHRGQFRYVLAALEERPRRECRPVDRSAAACTGPAVAAAPPLAGHPSCSLARISASHNDQSLK